MISVSAVSRERLSEGELARMMALYGDGLLRVCIVYMKDYSLAEDAVQETFLKAYRSYHTFQGRSSEKTWLTAIAINVCKTMLRNPWRRNVGEDALLMMQSTDPKMGDPTVSRAVMKLPRHQREVIVLFYIQGMKIREIAEILGVAIPTVSSRLSRAREALRQALKEWYFDEE